MLSAHYIRYKKEISFYFLKKESEIIIFVPKPSFLSIYLCYNKSIADLHDCLNTIIAYFRLVTKLFFGFLDNIFRDF